VTASICGFSIALIGIRIRVDCEKAKDLPGRVRQLDSLIHHVGKQEKAQGIRGIMLGDFNIGYYADVNWRYDKIKSKFQGIGYEIYPDIKGKTDDYSWKMGGFSEGFAQDRLIATKSIKVIPNDPIYRWDFKDLAPSIYGRNEGCDDPYPPNPDHAILMVDIEL
jgi:hypothetical protein